MVFPILSHTMRGVVGGDTQQRRRRRWRSIKRGTNLEWLSILLLRRYQQNRTLNRLYAAMGKGYLMKKPCGYFVFLKN